MGQSQQKRGKRNGHTERAKCAECKESSKRNGRAERLEHTERAERTSLQDEQSRTVLSNRHGRTRTARVEVVSHAVDTVEIAETLLIPKLDNIEFAYELPRLPDSLLVWDMEGGQSRLGKVAYDADVVIDRARANGEQIVSDVGDALDDVAEALDNAAEALAAAGMRVIGSFVSGGERFVVAVTSTGERIVRRVSDISSEAVAGAASKAAAVTLASTLSVFSASPLAYAQAAGDAFTAVGLDGGAAFAQSAQTEQVIPLQRTALEDAVAEPADSGNAAVDSGSSGTGADGTGSGATGGAGAGSGATGTGGTGGSATESTTPGSPADPANPTNPASPTNPTGPADSAHPTDPANPTAPDSSSVDGDSRATDRDARDGSAEALVNEAEDEFSFELAVVDPKNITTAEELQEGLQQDGGSSTLTLMADIQLTGSLTIGQATNPTINLNGHTLRSAGSQPLFSTGSSAKLTLKGSGAVVAGGAIASNTSSTGAQASITQDGPSVTAGKLFTTTSNWRYTVNTGSLTLSQQVTMDANTEFTMIGTGASFTSTASPYAVTLNSDSSRFSVGTFGRMNTSHSALQINSAMAEASFDSNSKLTVASGDAITCTTDIKQVILRANSTVIAQSGKVFAVVGNVSPSINAAANAKVSDTSIMAYLPSGRKMVYNPSTAANPYKIDTVSNLNAKGYAGIVDGVYCMTAADFDAYWSAHPDAVVQGVECTATFYQEDGYTVAKTVKVFKGHCFGGAHAGLAGTDTTAPTAAEMDALGGADSTFTGWLGSDGTTYTDAQLATLPISTDMSFTAQYKDAFQRFNVQFTYGLDGSQSVKKVVKEGSTIVFPTAAEVTSGAGVSSDWELIGWFTARTGGTQVADANGMAVSAGAGGSGAGAGGSGGSGAGVIATGNATYYAQYKYVGTYDVTFSYRLSTDAASTGAATPAAQTVKVKAGETIGAGQIPTPPALNKCVFSGWYAADVSGAPTGDKLSAATIASAAVNGPVRYVGVYEKAPVVMYSIGFSWGMTGVGSGVQTRGPIEVEQGTAVVFPTTTEVTSGAGLSSDWQLTGWFTARSGGTQVADANGRPLSDSAAASVSGNATYYAQYKYVGTYDVTFSYRLSTDAASTGSTAPATQTVKVKAGETVGATRIPTAPALNKCVFSGWYAADASGAPTGDKLSAETIAGAVVNGPVRYVGVYEKAPVVMYSIGFSWGMAGVGSGVQTRGPVEVEQGTAVTFPTAAEVTSGAGIGSEWEFLGWFTARSGGTQVADANGTAVGSEAGGGVIATGNATYYAQYKSLVATTCAVQFRWGGAYISDGNADALDAYFKNTEVERGKTPTAIPDDALVAVSGYRFVGWFDDAGNRLDPTTPIVVDRVYTARYERIQTPPPNPGDQGGSGATASDNTDSPWLPPLSNASSSAPPWTAVGARAAGVPVPGAARGLDSDEEDNSDGADPVLAGTTDTGAGSPDNDNSAGGSDSTPPFGDSDESDIPFQTIALEVAVPVALASGTALAAFAMTRIARFFAANGARTITRTAAPPR